MSSIILLMPFGLGDHIICHGIVREYCQKYDRVAIFTMPQNQASVSFMFRDLKNLDIIVGDQSFAKNFILSSLKANLVETPTTKYDYLKIIGFQYFDPHSGVLFEKQEYQLAGLDLEKKWDNFIVHREKEREEALLNKLAPKGAYAFLHEDAGRNYLIKRGLISKQLSITTPKPELTNNIFDYCTTIERAEEIHVIDSSFMFLVDCLDYSNPKQKLYVHRYSRGNEDWKLPILKKNWHILISGYSRTEQIFNRNKFLLQKALRKISRGLSR
mgnify:CR=1 FL=1